MVLQGFVVPRGGGDATDGDESSATAFPRNDHLNIMVTFMCLLYLYSIISRFTP